MESESRGEGNRGAGVEVILVDTDPQRTLGLLFIITSWSVMSNPQHQSFPACKQHGHPARASPCQPIHACCARGYFKALLTLMAIVDSLAIP